MKKILIALAGLAVISALLWKPLATVALKQYLKSYCANCWNADFQAEDIDWKDGRWIINRPTILEISDSGITLEAKQVAIRNHWNWDTRSIHVDIAVVEPICRANISKNYTPSKNSSSASFFSFSLPNLPMIAIDGNLYAENGILSIEKQDENPQEYAFTLHSHWKDQHTNDFTIDIAKGNEKATVRTLESPAATVSVNLQNMNLPPLVKLATYIQPAIANWEIPQGSVNGSLIIQSKGSDFLINGDVALQHVQIANQGFRVKGSIPLAVLSFKNNGSYLSQTLNCSLSEDAVFTLINDSLSPAAANMHGMFSLGLEQPLQMQLEGTCSYGTETFPLKISSTGASQIALSSTLEGNQLNALIPKHLKQVASALFRNKAFSFNSSIKPADLGFALNGVLQTVDEPNEKIDLGFEFVKQPLRSDWNGLLEASAEDPEAMALFASAAMLAKDTPSITLMQLQNGWFKSSNLRLEDYLKAIFPENIELSAGIRNLEGSFDSSTISAAYSLTEALFENHAIKYFQPESQDLGGKFHLNLASGDYEGTIFVKNAVCLEKNSGLNFTGIDGSFSLKPDEIKSDYLEAFLNGIALTSSLDLKKDLKQDSIVAEIHLNSAEGKLSQAKELMKSSKHFRWLEEVPIEGTFALASQGCDLSVIFEKEPRLVSCRLHALLNDGSITYKDASLCLRDLSSRIDYDLTNNTLAFSDVQGTLFLGSPELSEEYVVAGEQISFQLSDKPHVDFDIWLGDRARDIIRLAGSTTNLAGKDSLSFHLNELSHVGDAFPDNFELVLHRWSEIESFRLQLSFQLASLINELNHLRNTGFKIFTKGVLKNLHKVQKPEGYLKLNLEYDNSASLLTYAIEGREIAIDGYALNNCSLAGKKKDSSWVIEHLQLNDLAMSADITQREDFWKVNFLGLRYGNSILAGLEGIIYPKESIFDAKVNLLNIHMAALKEFPFLKDVSDKFNPKGDLQASGSLEIALVPEKPRCQAKASLNVSLKNCEAQGMKISDVKNLTCQIVSDKELAFIDFPVTIQDAATQEPKAFINCDKISYNFPNHEIIFDKMHFHVPAEHLEWIAVKAHDLYPDLLNNKTAMALASLKHEGNLEGAITVTRSDKQRNLKMQLADGSYKLFGRDYYLKNLTISHQPSELKCLAEYVYDNNPYQIALISHARHFTSGDILISNPTDSNLKIHWLNLEQLHPSISYVEGQLCGIGVHLVQQSQGHSQDISLIGDMHFDIPQANPFMLKLGSLLDQCKAQGSYTLKGTWTLSADNLSRWRETLQFTGTLEGHQIAFNDIRFDALQAQLAITPEKISLSHLAIHDDAGRLKAEGIDLYQQEGIWLFKAPLIAIHELHPSRLKLNKPQKPSENAFTIKLLEVRDLAGSTSNHFSIQAHGRACCLNPAVHGMQHWIVNVSSELLNKLRLDPSLLTPASGTIDYEIKGGKILLKKFKEMYSAGKMSKFYLVKDSRESSYIDFDGNINAKIRMKQYNLLYKIAELFTLHITGTLWDPRYSLSKEK